ncbi:MAG: hypothetical protein RLY67_545 [Pseudomonadota bacterium]
MDLAEIEKRIADLKSVEHWLNLNLNMVKATLQALEIQRGTLINLRAFQESMTPSEHSTDASANDSASPTPRASGEPAHEGMAMAAASQSAWLWNQLQSQFNQMASLAESGSESLEKSGQGRDKTPKAKASRGKASDSKAEVGAISRPADSGRSSTVPKRPSTKKPSRAPGSAKH